MSELDDLERELRVLRSIPTPPRAPAALEGVMARLYAETEEFRETLKPEIRVDIPAIPDQSEAIRALTASLAELIDVLRAKEATVVVNLPEEIPAPMRITFIRNRVSGELEGAIVEDA